MNVPGTPTPQTGQLTTEQMTRFLEGVREPYNQHEQEKRRGLQISVGFFEKLAALNAGSIAVAASIILSIVLKSDHPVAHSILREILKVVVLLWMSFALSLIHNILAVVVAHVETAYSNTEFIVSLMKLSLALVREGVTIDDATADQISDAMQLGIHPKRNRLAKAMNLIYPTANIIGYVAMATSVAAYALVMFYLWKLW